MHPGPPFPPGNTLRFNRAQRVELRPGHIGLRLFTQTDPEYLIVLTWDFDEFMPRVLWPPAPLPSPMETHSPTEEAPRYDLELEAARPACVILPYESPARVMLRPALCLELLYLTAQTTERHEYIYGVGADVFEAALAVQQGRYPRAP